jgi:hypothetical protein
MMTNKSDNDSLSISEMNSKLELFSNKTVFHPKLKRMFNDIYNHVKQENGYPLLIMYGPTGVGKSTLRYRLEKQITEDFHKQDAYPSYMIPVTSIEAASPESGSYNWKDHDIRCLEALHEPLPGEKIIFQPDIFQSEEQHILSQQRLRKTSTTPELRRALENALKMRSPRLFIIDEAQHLKKVGSGRRLLDQMDMIKSLANNTNIKHLMIGTYELQDLLDLNAQLTRRTVEFHFPRYRYDNQDDVNQYYSIINTFQKMLPTDRESNLIASFDYLYEYSLGCVGILKVWLYQCLAFCLENKHKAITQKTLEQTALPIRRLRNIATEIFEGEKYLKEHESYDLRAALNMPTTRVAINMSKPSQKPKTKNQQPGIRLPKRDNVGGNKE